MQELEVGSRQYTENSTRRTWRSWQTWWSQDINMIVSLTRAQGRRYGILRNGLIMIAPAYDSAKGISLYLRFEHMSGDHVAQNCRYVEESCRTWMEDRAGTLVSGNSWSYMGSNWVCCRLWIIMNLRMQYTSWTDTRCSWYSDLRFCRNVSSRLGNIVSRTSLSVVRVCWIHNISYAVSVSSQCKRSGRLWVYKEEIQHRGRTVKVQWRLRGNVMDSSSQQCQDCQEMGHK